MEVSIPQIHGGEIPECGICVAGEWRRLGVWYGLVGLGRDVANNKHQTPSRFSVSPPADPYTCCQLRSLEVTHIQQCQKSHENPLGSLGINKLASAFDWDLLKASLMKDSVVFLFF